MHKDFPYPLYLVISQADCRLQPWLTVAEEAIIGGVDIIQLREKHLDTKAFVTAATALKNLTDKYGIPLIINDNVDVAQSIGAFGVHVGNSDVSPVLIRERWSACRCIGYSIEYLTQLETTAASESDYFGISPVYSTLTKLNTVTQWGLSGIERIRSLCTKPLVAIGGMQSGNAGDAIRAGVDSVAVVSAICSSADPRQAAAQLKSIITSI